LSRPVTVIYEAHQCQGSRFLEERYLVDLQRLGKTPIVRDEKKGIIITEKIIEDGSDGN